MKATPAVFICMLQVTTFGGETFEFLFPKLLQFPLIVILQDFFDFECFHFARFPSFRQVDLTSQSTAVKHKG